MQFNSFKCIVFFPLAVICFYIIPHKYRKHWLLVCSYYFYMCWNPLHVIILFLATVTTYICTILMGRNDAKRKAWLLVCIIINTGLLVFFKYIGFLAQNILALLPQLESSSSTPFYESIVLPVGISFYTFQLIGYAVDVYRHDTIATRNFLSFALFASFFPQLVAGPIERANFLLPQIEKVKTRYDRDIYLDLYTGFYQMMWGFFLKLVIADRLSIMVDNALANYSHIGLIGIIVSVFYFTIRIYCDFNGYSFIARGAAKCLGIDLSQNFKQPYFAKSIHDFWKRWHITLTQWFTRYLYIPLGGNRKGKLNKLINVMIVFLCSGLWHGASWHYVVWGCFHGLLYVVEELFKIRVYKDKTNCLSKIVGGVRIVATFVCVSLGWLFFFAPSVKVAVSIMKQAVMNINASGLNYLGIKKEDAVILALAILVMVIVDYLHEREKSIFLIINTKLKGVRHIIYVGIIWAIIIFGVYGGQYDASKFIYFQF